MEKKYTVLRYVAAITTEIAVGFMTAGALWAWTKMDLVQVMVVAFFAGSLTGLFLFLGTEPADEEADEEEDRGPVIYTLREGQFYGRRIS